MCWFTVKANNHIYIYIYIYIYSNAFFSFGKGGLRILSVSLAFFSLTHSHTHTHTHTQKQTATTTKISLFLSEGVKCAWHFVQRWVYVAEERILHSNPAFWSRVLFLCRCLFGFYGISTFVGNLKPNFVCIYTCNLRFLNEYFAGFHFLHTIKWFQFIIFCGTNLSFSRRTERHSFWRCQTDRWDYSFWKIAFWWEWILWILWERVYWCKAFKILNAVVVVPVSV